jgi:hypothetical protein
MIFQLLPLKLILTHYVLTSFRIYKTVILHVVLYGCETLSPTVTEERKLRVFENRGLRRILGTKLDREERGWRNLHNEELHKLFSSQSVIRIIKSRRMRWAGHVARMGRKLTCRHLW